jgi:NADH-quinone oxidoreductase subunit L
VAVGIGIAYRMHANQQVPEIAPAGSALTIAARNDLYGDALNERVLMRPGQRVTAGLVEIDEDVVEGATRGLATVISDASQRLRRWQTGFARSYALSMLAGTVLVIGAILMVRIW